MTDWQPPLFLLGTQRSGTTWLGKLLSALPGAAYWIEPRHVWTRGNAYRPDDLLTASDATPAIKQRIRRTFTRFVADQDCTRLVEKTPSNCLRVPFIHEIFPEAKILLVIRDGRSVIAATERMQRKNTPASKITQRMREMPLWEWPSATPVLVDTMRARVLRKPLRYWGPRPPGWRQWTHEHSPEVIRAKQWAHTIKPCWESCQALPESSWACVRFESLVSDPAAVLRKALEHLDVQGAEGVLEQAGSSSKPSKAFGWRDELASEILNCVRPHLEPTLRLLGYEWDAS
jgi:sulfotransferase family protein